MTDVDLTQPDHRPNVYHDEDTNTIVYRASAIGGCTKMLAALRQGYEATDVPEWLRAKMDESTSLENEAIDSFIADYGPEIESIERDVAPVELQVGYTDDNAKSRIIIRGKGDTVAKFHNGKSVVVEAKNLGPSLFSAYTNSLPFSYKAQGTVYYVGHDSIVYVLRNKETREVKYRWFDESPASLKALFDKVNEVERIAAEFTLPDKCDPMQFPCPVYYTHETQVVEPWEDLSLQYEFEELCRAYDEARQAESDGKKAKKSLQRKLLAFKAAHPDLFLAGAIESIHGRLTVSTGNRMGIDEVDLEEFLADNGKSLSDFMVSNEYEITRVTYRK